MLSVIPPKAGIQRCRLTGPQLDPYSYSPLSLHAPSVMIDSAFLERLIAVCGREHVSVDPADLDRYSCDALTPHRVFHDTDILNAIAWAVVKPGSSDEVSQVMRLACEFKVPVVPHGGGTGVMGAAIPVQGGVILDLKRLNRVTSVNPEDMTVVVEAGAVLADVNAVLEPHALMLGHDPWSVPIATVGGAISTNGVGYLAAAHGPMGQQVAALEVVLPTGELLTTKAVPKSSSGPNLNQLFIGSEGVFGVITKATLHVFRVPEERSFSALEFPSFDSGFNAVAECLALGIRPSLVDLSEESDHRVHLYLMHEGFKEGVEAQSRRCMEVCKTYGGVDLGPNRTLEYWNHRHSSGISYKQEMLGQPRKVRWERRWRAFDYLHVALPISKVLEYRRICEGILEENGLKAVEYAIWGQPELFSMLIVPADDADIRETRTTPAPGMGETVDRILSLAQDMGGSMEYCHGVGVKLAHLLPREMEGGYEAAAAIKKALDPHSIMNPGKLFQP